MGGQHGKGGEKAKTPLDAHLMVNNPLEFISWISNFNLENITLHYEACENPLNDILKAKKLFPRIGVSIKPGTDPSVLSDEILKEVNLVLVMSVEPGFGGQSFMDNSLEKIKKLKERRESLSTSFIIQVDGGVNLKTAPLVIQSGADNLVAGSYVFNVENNNYQEKINQLLIQK